MTGSRNDSEINVLLTFDSKYLVSALVTCLSLLDKLAPHSKAILYLGYQDVSDQQRDFFQAKLLAYSCDVHWLPIDADLWQSVYRQVGYMNGSLMTYARMYLEELLPKSLSKVLYLDSDLLILRDVSELYRLEFDGAVAMASIDRDGIFASVWSSSLCDRLRISPFGPYFNAGVLLIDLSQWRREEIGAKARNAASLYRNDFPLGDQCALNFALAGRWKRLPMRWNECLQAPWITPQSLGHHSTKDLFDAIFRPGIVHFLCRQPRPWIQRRICPRTRHYWRYLKQALGVCDRSVLPPISVRSSLTATLEVICWNSVAFTSALSQKIRHRNLRRACGFLIRISPPAVVMFVFERVQSHLFRKCITPFVHAAIGFIVPDRFRHSLGRH